MLQNTTKIIIIQILATLSDSGIYASKMASSPIFIVSINWMVHNNIQKLLRKRSSESLIFALIQNHIKKGLKLETGGVPQRGFEFYANEALNREEFSCETLTTLTDCFISHSIVLPSSKLSQQCHKVIFKLRFFLFFSFC